MGEVKELAIMFGTPISPFVVGLITVIIIPNAVIATITGMASFFCMMYMGRNIDMDL